MIDFVTPLGLEQQSQRSEREGFSGLLDAGRRRSEPPNKSLDATARCARLRAPRPAGQFDR